VWISSLTISLANTKFAMSGAPYCSSILRDLARAPKATNHSGCFSREARKAALDTTTVLELAARDDHKVLRSRSGDIFNNRRGCGDAKTIALVFRQEPAQLSLNP
jgi:hypothetical protein